MNEDRKTQETQQPEAPHPLDERLSELWRVLRRESILWPVLVAVSLAGITLGAALLYLALFLEEPAALLALAILLVGCIDLSRREIRRRGIGPLTGMLAAFWLLAGAALPAARALGLL